MVGLAMADMTFPTALDPPKGRVVLLNENLLTEAMAASRRSPRKRIILPFHQDHQELLHRMMNVMQPGTYIRPHRHLAPPKAESIVVLRGGMWLALFTDEGEVDGAWHLKPGYGEFGVDIAPGVFHTFIVTEPDTVLFEVKPGPYQQSSDKDFASWAPAEGEADARCYQETLLAGLSSRVASG